MNDINTNEKYRKKIHTIKTKIKNPNIRKTIQNLTKQHADKMRVK